MELNHLKHFYEVAKSGSFARASLRLRISQSSLSKAVQLLETSSQVKLFSRSKAGVSLTPVGQEVFAKCERLFETFAEIEQTCLQKVEAPRGDLKLGASDHVTKYLLVKLLRKLKGKYPELLPSVFSAGPNEIVASILNNEIEFGLFFTQVPLPQILYQEVAQFPMAIVCHPQLFPSQSKKLSASELRKFARKVGLITSTASRYNYNPSERAVQQLGTPPINFEMNSQEAQKQMCLAKGGMVILARFMVEDEIRTGKLTELEIRNPISLSLYLASRKSRAPSVNAQAFMEALNQELSVTNG